MNQPKLPAQPTESEASLADIPSGTQIKLRILSATPASYAQPWKEISVTVP